MIRNLKVLGLAMMAMFAFGAIAASGASAQEKEQGELTSDGPVTLTGEEVGGVTENRLTSFGGFVQCPGSTYSVHAIGGGFLPGTGSTVGTITPNYKQTSGGTPNCTGPLGVSATVDMNGCDYRINLGTTTPAGNNEGTYGVTFDIDCPDNQEITVTLWRSATEHVNNPETPFCDLHVSDEDAEGNPTNKGLAGAHATDEAEGHVRLRGTVEGIHVTRTLTHGSPGLLCSNGSTEAGKFDLNVTTSGHNELGEDTGVEITEVAH